MMYPPLDELLKKTDSRYALAVIVSKRAHQLVEGATPLIPCDSIKPVTIAIEELYEGRLKCGLPGNAMDPDIEKRTKPDILRRNDY